VCVVLHQKLSFSPSHSVSHSLPAWWYGSVCVVLHQWVCGGCGLLLAVICGGCRFVVAGGCGLPAWDVVVGYGLLLTVIGDGGESMEKNNNEK
jgi:hypothetical protein